LAGSGVALASAGLVACSSILVEYSTNARGYTLVALVFVLMLGTGEVLLRRRSVLGWSALTLLAGIGFWTIPVMLFPYGAGLIWLAVSSRTPQTQSAYQGTFFRWLFASVLLTGTLTALLYAPVILVSGGGALFGNRFVTPLTWGQLYERLPASLLST